MRSLLNFNRTGFILGCGNWDRYDFKALLKLVKSFVLLVWDMRKNKLYGDQDGTTPGCSGSCPLTGDLTSSACVCGCVHGQWRKRYGSNMSILLLVIAVHSYIASFPGLGMRLIAIHCKNMRVALM